MKVPGLSELITKSIVEGQWRMMLEESSCFCWEPPLNTIAAQTRKSELNKWARYEYNYYWLELLIQGKWTQHFFRGGDYLGDSLLLLNFNSCESHSTLLRTCSIWWVQCLFNCNTTGRKRRLEQIFPKTFSNFNIKENAVKRISLPYLKTPYIDSNW